MVKNLFLSLVLFLPCLLLAQKPQWKSKFTVHHPISGMSDTIWIGCDENGALGYQAGLDVLDTGPAKMPIFIRVGDPVVKSQLNTDCSNLKTSILNFDTFVEWLVYVYSDSFPPYPFPDAPDSIHNAISVTWDTIEFVYSHNSYYLADIILYNLNGYFSAEIDGTYFPIYQRNKAYLFKNNAYIELENPSWECASNIYAFKFKIRVAFADPVGFKSFGGQRFKVFPNPNRGRFTIITDQHLNGKLSITDSKGKLITSMDYYGTEASININSKPGLYLLRITDDKGSIWTKKLLIQL
jgi:hypothetical protein